MAYVDIVTALAVLQFVVFGFRVGGARGKYGIKAPAITGNEIFERHFRVQQNTLEQLIVFLPGLYLFAHYWNPPTGNSTISVVVSFTIHRDGTMSDPEIAKGSGNASLDNLALRAVKLAAPFGALPPGFPSDNLELSCTLIPTRN